MDLHAARQKNERTGRVCPHPHPNMQNWRRRGKEERDMRQSRNLARRQRGEKEGREAMRLSRTGFWQRGVGLPYGEVGG